MIFNPPTLTIDSVGKLSNVPDILVSDVMQAFTMANPKFAEAQKRSAFAAQKIPKQLKYFSMEKDYISFPRGATRVVINLCQKRGIKLVLRDNRVSRPLEQKIDFVGTLRDYQQEASDVAAVNDFGVIEASTGSGKTVIACDLIARRSENTIISVPTVDLMYQWRDRLKSFNNIEDIGFIGDGVYDVKPITVAVINSLNKHAADLAGYFGYLIVDEAHRVASDMYIGGPLTQLATKYMTGLSATLMRGDGLIELLYWFVGRVLHKVDPGRLRDIKAVLKPLVWQKDTGFNYTRRGSYSSMISEMVADLARNNCIVDEVVADTRRKGEGDGVTVVVSDRVEHLKILEEKISARLGADKVVLLTGRTSPNKRKKIIEDLNYGLIDVVCSSLSLISEGLDCPWLDSLHLATPITDRKRVIQTAGRILRPEEGKIPIIVDYVDRQIGMLDYRAKQRLEIFKNDVFGTVVTAPPWSQDGAPYCKQPSLFDIPKAA